MEIALDQCGTANERRLAIVDKNRDLYLTQVRVYGAARKTIKLGKYPMISFSLVFLLMWTIFIGRKAGEIIRLVASFVCLYFRALLFELFDLRPSFLVWVLTLT